MMRGINLQEISKTGTMGNLIIFMGSAFLKILKVKTLLKKFMITVNFYQELTATQINFGAGSRKEYLKINMN